MDKILSDASSSLINNSVLGTCLVLAILAVIALTIWIRQVYTLLFKAKDEHAGDLRKFALEGEATRQVLAKSTSAQDNSTTAIRDLIALLHSRGGR